MSEWIRRLTGEEVEGWRGPAATGGPLSGVSFAIKDNLDLARVPTTAACPGLAGVSATSSAVAVQRLIDAGAVPAGKTNMDQFATGLVGTRSPYGACRSVVEPSRISGGSSSGSAVAVASGQVPLALGTDTAGSGRVPAGFNGIVGVKPTRGLISTRGLLPACRSLDCVTTLTKTVADALPALEVLISYDELDPWSRRMPARPPAGAPARMRVLGVPSAALDLDDRYRPAWQEALGHARAIAAQVIPVDVTPFLDAGALLYQGPWIAERWAAFGSLLDLDGVDPTVRRVVSAGREVSGAAVFEGLDRLARLRRSTEAVWADIDALLLPTAPCHPTPEEVARDPIGVNARLGTFTNFVNLLDLCAVAAPAGTGPAFGVQLIAPAFADLPLWDLASRWCGEGPLGTCTTVRSGSWL